MILFGVFLTLLGVLKLFNRTIDVGQERDGHKKPLGITVGMGGGGGGVEAPPSVLLKVHVT